MPSSACQKCARSEEHTSELQSHSHLVCRLLLEKKNLFPSDLKNTRLNSSPTLISYLVFYFSGGTPLLLSSPPKLSSSSLMGRPFVFFFNDPATPEIYPLSLHDALPINDTATTEDLHSFPTRRSSDLRWSPYH